MASDLHQIDNKIISELVAKKNNELQRSIT